MTSCSTRMLCRVSLHLTIHSRRIIPWLTLRRLDLEAASLSCLTGVALPAVAVILDAPAFASPLLADLCADADATGAPATLGAIGLGAVVVDVGATAGFELVGGVMLPPATHPVTTGTSTWSSNDEEESLLCTVDELAVSMPT